MSTANPVPSAASLQLIDQRLDAIDRALLGLLPRGERIAMVGQLETRLRELAAASPASETSSQAATEMLSLVESADLDSALASGDTPNFPRPRASAGRTHRATDRKLSRLALAAGVLGIVALVLLFMTPIVYYVVAIASEMTDEMVGISLLSAHTLVVAVGGVAAVSLGIAALVRINRRSRNLAGYGWAITGLCTGPMPMLAGGIVVLIVGVQLLGSPVVRVVQTTNPPPAANSTLPPLLDPPPAELDGTVATYSDSDLREAEACEYHGPTTKSEWDASTSNGPPPARRISVPMEEEDEGAPLTDEPTPNHRACPVIGPPPGETRPSGRRPSVFDEEAEVSPEPESKAPPAPAPESNDESD